jgi:hypothetical protein
MGARFPAAANRDGSPMTGMVREEFVPDTAEKGSPITFALTYPSAHPDGTTSATLSARQSWRDDANGSTQAETLTYDEATCVANDCAKSSTNFDVAIGEGVSQSGRFMRDFLYQGFNQDANGKIVFDGIMPIVPAARGTWVNEPFSEPGRWSREHEDHFTPGFEFPFAYNVITDPVSGVPDGLMKRCEATQTCPKIMQICGEFERWGGGASLVVTNGAGKDLTLPPNVRYYLVQPRGLPAPSGASRRHTAHVVARGGGSSSAAAQAWISARCTSQAHAATCPARCPIGDSRRTGNSYRRLRHSN